MDPQTELDFMYATEEVFDEGPLLKASYGLIGTVNGKEVHLKFFEPPRENKSTL